MIRIVTILNLPRHLCRAALGKDHTVAHRMAAGTVIMVGGVVLSKTTVPGLDLHLFFDLVGYLIHGIGAVPFVEYLIAEE